MKHKLKIHLEPREQPKEWSKYGTYSVIATVNDNPKKCQIIMQGDRPVYYPTPSYQLIPNGLVVDMFEEIMPKLGATTFTKYQSSEHTFFKKDSEKPYIIGDKHHDRIGLLWKLNEFDNIDVTDGDPIVLGALVESSINGTTGINARIFSWRPSCFNYFIHPPAVKEFDKLDLHERNVLTMASTRHTRQIAEDTKEKLTRNIKAVIDGANNVLARYKERVQRKVNEELAKKIVNSHIPKSIIDSLDYINVTTKDNEQKIVLTHDVTQWECFNDITKKLTHGVTNINKKGKEITRGFTYGGTLNHMREIDGIFA